MTVHPYREPCFTRADSSAADRDVTIVVLLIWAFSVVRAIVAVAAHEHGREVTFAAALVLALPFSARLWR